MTLKQQLIQEIEQASETLALQLLDLLHLLQAQPPSPTPETLDNPFKDIDGFMVIKQQTPLPNLDWVSLIREERINDLTSP
jgi:hypothetical protein